MTLANKTESVKTFYLFFLLIQNHHYLLNCTTVILLQKGQIERHLQRWQTVGSLFIVLCVCVGGKSWECTK